MSVESFEKPRTPIWKVGIDWLFRIILAVVFLYAGWTKMQDPGAFAGAIATFELVPESWSNAIALVLPPFEILLSGLILIPAGVRAASFGLAVMTLLFTLALVSGLLRGLPVDCGCFGSGGPSTPAQIGWAIARDIGLLFFSGWVWLSRMRESPSFAMRPAFAGDR